MPIGILAWHVANRSAPRTHFSMSKYIITVTEIFPPTSTEAQATTSTQEIFKLGVDEFDPLTFCAALKQKTRGRKPGKKEGAS